jgi:excisionase family DNA binding protein
MGLLTVKQAAERLGVKPGTVYDLVTGRKIRFARIGNGRGRIRIPEDAIDEYLARATFAPLEPKAPAVRVKLKHLSLD